MEERSAEATATSLQSVCLRHSQASSGCGGGAFFAVLPVPNTPLQNLSLVVPKNKVIKAFEKGVRGKRRRCAERHTFSCVTGGDACFLSKSFSPAINQNSIKLSRHMEGAE